MAGLIFRVCWRAGRPWRVPPPMVGELSKSCCGHQVLDLGVLHKALREVSAETIRTFEETFEPLGLTALAILLITGP